MKDQKYTHQYKTAEVDLGFDNEQYQFDSLDEAVLAKVDNGEAGVDDMLIINHGDEEIKVRVIDESGDYVVLNGDMSKDMQCDNGECVIGISHGINNIIVKERDFFRLDDDGLIFKYCPDCGRKFDHE